MLHMQLSVGYRSVLGGEKESAHSRFASAGSVDMYLAATSLRVGGTTRCKLTRFSGKGYTEILVLRMVEVHEEMTS